MGKKGRSRRRSKSRSSHQQSNLFSVDHHNHQNKKKQRWTHYEYSVVSSQSIHAIADGVFGHPYGYSPSRDNNGQVC